VRRSYEYGVDEFTSLIASNFEYTWPVQDHFDSPRGMYITNQPADAAYSTHCISKKLLPQPRVPAIKEVA